MKFWGCWDSGHGQGCRTPPAAAALAARWGPATAEAVEEAAGKRRRPGITPRAVPRGVGTRGDRPALPRCPGGLRSTSLPGGAWNAGELLPSPQPQPPTSPRQRCRGGPSQIPPGFSGGDRAGTRGGTATRAPRERQPRCGWRRGAGCCGPAGRGNRRGGELGVRDTPPPSKQRVWGSGGTPWLRLCPLQGVRSLRRSREVDGPLGRGFPIARRSRSPAPANAGHRQGMLFPDGHGSSLPAGLRPARLQRQRPSPRPRAGE